MAFKAAAVYRLLFEGTAHAQANRFTGSIKVKRYARCPKNKCSYPDIKVLTIK